MTFFKRQVMPSMAAFLLLGGSAVGAERRLFEPETFRLDGASLSRYPAFQEDAPGWYAVETSCRAYGGEGGGYSAAIHEGAARRVITARVEPALPAGAYQVFFSSAGMIWQDRPTVIRVGLGAAVTNVAWTQASHRIGWMPGGRIDLAQPADTITLEAVQWGGKGFAQLYDIGSRCIVIDQVYVTADLVETTGPTSVGAAVVQGDRAAPADAISAPGTGYREVSGAPTPPPLGTPRSFAIRLAAVDGRTNLLPNSSFELGGGDGWATANSSQAGNVHLFGEADHLRDACHGEYALRLPGKGVRGLQFSRVFELPESGIYTFSGHVKALGSGAGKVTVRLTPIGAGNRFEDEDAKLANKRSTLRATVTPTAEWQRFAVTGPLEAGPCVLAVNGACLLDAVQLERGGTATAYGVRATLEASLAADRPAHVFHDDGPTELTAWAHNAGGTATNVALTYRIVDVRERVIEERTLRMDVPAGRTVSRPVVIEPVRRGLFNVVYAAAGRPYAEGELIYAVLPPVPARTPRHALASNMDNDPASFELMKRMGHQWQLYCKLYADRPEHLNPAPETYRWDELRAVLEMPRSSGLQVMPALWPSHVPPHLRDAERSAWDAYGDGRRDPVRQMRKQAGLPPEKRTAVLYPDLEAWRTHCRRLAEAVGDRQSWWTIEDETELYFSAREFARIVRATADGFRDSGKPMKISLSCMTDYIEEVIAELGGDMPMAGFGASSYDYEYWEARKARYLQQRWGVPWFCIGVGASGGPQFRRTGPFGKAVHGDAVRTAQRMVFLALVQDAKVIGHYTGRLRWSGGLSHDDFPLMDYDGTPLPHGFSFSCLPLLLSDAVPVEDVYLDALRTLVFVFRQNGRLHAVTWSNAFPGHDIHWPTEPRVWRDVRLPGAAGRITVADMYGNARDDIRQVGGDPVFELTEEPAFLFNDGLSDESFLAVVRGMTAAPRPVDLRLAFVPNGRGGVDLGVRTVNHTAASLTNLVLDANFPPNRMLTRVDWTLPDRQGRIGPVPAGATAWGRLATPIDLKWPVENASYTVWLTEADGREHAMVDTCWLTVAPRVRATVDGRLDEWGGIPAAWMYYTFSWNRFGRHIVQFVNQGEHFKYIRRPDARAAIRTGADDRHLYIAIECEDDDLVRKGTAAEADRLEIRINPAPGENEGIRTLVLDPAGSGVEVSGILADGATAAIVVSDRRGGAAPCKVWTVEAAIPLAALGGAKLAGDAIGFDVVWHDADHEGDGTVTGTWRWAGRSTSLGTLFFTP